MKSDRLNNCRICGGLFLKYHSDYCIDCYIKVEQQYKCVADFLSEENRYATIEEVSEHTGVSLKRIENFIRDGRIFAEAYENLGYQCAQCGKVIKRQVLCKGCYDQFIWEINRALMR